MVLNRYYEQELNHLRVLAAEFAKRNPALAPLLGSASAVDSDVERLLEGVAFMTGLVQQRLDDDFPEFTQGMAQLLFPQFLRPMPCMTILRYTLQVQEGKAVRVPAGTTYASVPVDGAPTYFRSAFPVTIEPVELVDAGWREPAQGTDLDLQLRFRHVDAASWPADSLRFWLGGGFSEASRLYRLLRHHLKEVQVWSSGASVTRLPASAVRAAGFDARLQLLPWPVGAHPAGRILQEYFALPEKHLFIDLEGLRHWRDRRDDLHIRFVLNGRPEWTPAVSRDSFVLNATPGVNLYGQEGHPVQVTHKQTEYRIQSAAHTRRHARIFMVERVTMRDAQGADVALRPFSAFVPGAPSYQVRIRPSPLETNGYDHYLSLPYAQGRQPRDHTLSLHLLCTDGDRANGLRLGDIREPTDNSPPQVACANILGVTAHRAPHIQGDLLWRILSHQNANHVTLVNRDTLCELLMLYLPQRQSDGHRDAAALRQIESIEDVRATQQRRMVRGAPIEGSIIEVTCRGDYFASPGSLYLFGCMLDEFFSASAAINTFTALSLHDAFSGETLTWPAKIGHQRLL